MLQRVMAASMGDVAARRRHAGNQATRQVLVLALFLALSYGAAAVGNFGMGGDWAPWYEQLEKPAWTPSGTLIGTVWVLLYTVMAIAAWMVWRETGWQRGAVPLGLFLAQLVLNALWSVLFFGAQRIGAAFVELLVLWLAILATTIAFARVRPLAAALMLPYLAWVAFAGYLNWTIWQLNT